MAQDDSKYTKPGLRERIKKRITAGSKGGKPGQWSARKAHFYLYMKLQSYTYSIPLSSVVRKDLLVQLLSSNSHYTYSNI